MYTHTHKQVIKRGDPKNGIAVPARVQTHESNHMIDWDGARVKRSGMTNYWQRRTTEAIHIKLSEESEFVIVIVWSTMHWRIYYAL